MTDLEILAISKAIPDKAAKAARPGVLPGSYEVDLLVHVSGPINVGEDNPSAVTAARIPDRAFMLWTLRKMNAATRSRTVREFKAWLDSGDGVETPDWVKPLWDEVMESTRGLRRGTVTNKLKTELVTATIEHPVPEEVPVQ